MNGARSSHDSSKDSGCTSQRPVGEASDVFPRSGRTDPPPASPEVSHAKCVCHGCCICGDHPKFDEPECPRCHGSGEIGWNPSPINDPQCALEAPCNICHGRGVVSALTAQAYELGWIDGEAA